MSNNSEHRRTTGEVKKTVRRPSWTPLEGHGVCLNHFLNLASNTGHQINVVENSSRNFGTELRVRFLLRSLA